MIVSVFKIFILLLAITSSVIWIGDKFLVDGNEKQYDFYELAENNNEENIMESNLKLLFIAPIEMSNCFEYYSLNKNRINYFYKFLIKEFNLKNFTPPPKID